MLKGHLRLLFLVLFINNLHTQPDTSEILFVGHAYGSHQSINNSLDPIFLDHYKNFSYSKVVFGGDFIYDCSSEIEVANFKNFYNNNDAELIIGNHDNCNSILELSENFKYYYHELINENLIFYLNTSKENDSLISSYFEYIDSTIKQESPKSIIIFTHQLIFSESDWFVRVNSRKFYDFGNKLFHKLYNEYYQTKIPFYFIAGDIGAFNLTPYAFYKQDNNFNLIASGIGNDFFRKAIKIIIGSDINIKFIDLPSGDLEDLNKYSQIKVQMYQLPKLLLFIIKSNYLLALSVILFFILIYLYLNRIKKKYAKK